MPYLRKTSCVAVTTSKKVIIVNAPESAPTSLEVDDEELFSKVWQRSIEQPFNLIELENEYGHQAAAYLKALIEAGTFWQDQDEELLWTKRNQVFCNSQPFYFKPEPKNCENITIALTGSIVSGLLAPSILSLAYSGFQKSIDIIITEAASKFVSPYLFESYGIRTWGSAFEHQRPVTVPHIEIAKKASCLLVMPASARSLARIASADCSDLLGLVTTAIDGPIIMAPTMNTKMWEHPGVRRNVQQLREDGVYIVEPHLFIEASAMTKRGAYGVGMAGLYWGGARQIMDTVAAVIGQKDNQAPTVE